MRGDPPGVREVKEFCRGRLAGYKIPKRILSIDEIPRNPSGKILKYVLRDQLADPDTPS